MPVFQIIEGKRRHCGEIVRRLRAEHADAIVRLGVDAHRRLVEVFENSPAFCRAWRIDGRLAALGGLEGPLAGATGTIWLALSAEACRYPVAMTREVKRQLFEILRIKRNLVTVIFESDLASMRFARHLGFERCGDPFEQQGERLIPVSLREALPWRSPPLH